MRPGHGRLGRKAARNAGRRPLRSGAHAGHPGRAVGQCRGGVEKFPAIFAADSPGNAPTSAPMLVYQGLSDDVVYKVFTDQYVQRVEELLKSKVAEVLEV